LKQGMMTPILSFFDDDHHNNISFPYDSHCTLMQLDNSNGKGEDDFLVIHGRLNSSNCHE